MNRPSRLEDRVRFEQFSLAHLPTGECEATVTLAWGNHPPSHGTARSTEGAASGEIQCAAQACLNALAAVTRESSFELLGVKAVQAFDATVVIVSVAAVGQSDGPRLVGSYLAGTDLPRGAALAVLNATNRSLAARRPQPA